MNASILNIGDELLIGQVVNTNASVMSQMLINKGFDVQQTLVISDSKEAILHSLDLLLGNSEIVIITGGLGPTKDDITKHTLCEYFHSTLVEDTSVVEHVKELLARLGYPLSPVNRAQGLVPECCTVIPNELGTAPGMWFEKDGKVIISLPGVPFEMENLMKTEVLPRLQKFFKTGHILNKNILVQGIGESFLSDLIEPWELSLPSFIRLAYLPQAGMVKLRLTARGESLSELEKAISKAVKELYPIAGQYIVGEDLETLPEVVANHFLQNHLTLSTAESCTGGLIAQRLTSLSGASGYFIGGIVSYSNQVKENQLGVPSEILETHGAVSEPTAMAMAKGVREKLKTDFSIATTGVAGPTGGSEEKPVGTVWIAIDSPLGCITKLCHFGKDRLRTIERASNEAYKLLIQQANLYLSKQ